MYRLLLLITVALFIVLAPACRTGGGSGSPGITRSNRGGGTGAGPGIYKPKYVGVGHSPSVSGSKKKSDPYHGPVRQHGKK